MLDRRQLGDDRAEPACREHQRIAAAQDHLPDARMRADIGERRRERLAAEHARALADAFAPEAEAAISGAHVDDFQQHAVGVAVHDPRGRHMRIVAGRIDALALVEIEFRAVGHELSRNRIIPVARIDRFGDRRRDGDRVARGNALELGEFLRRREPGRDEIGGGTENIFARFHGESDFTERFGFV